MKHLTGLIAFLLLATTTMQAQYSKVAYIDMEKVLESVEEYTAAQKQLEQQSERWRQEIAREYEQIEQMYREYQTREPLLSDEMRKAKQDEIVAKEKAVRAMQTERFGPEGLLFKKRQSLVKPIQEKVYAAVQKLAKERKYDFVFTAPDGATLIYADEEKDLTNDVISRLGN